jgi:hypothetical protein
VPAQLIFTGHSDDLAEFEEVGQVVVNDDPVCDEFDSNEKNPGWRVDLTAGGHFFVRATFHPSGVWHIYIEPDAIDADDQTGFPEAVRATYSMDDYKQVCVIDIPEGGATVSRWVIE